MPDSAPATKAPKPEARLPLEGLVVIDLTRARAGPTAIRHLADWGANVICVQPSGAEGEDVSGDRDSSDFQNLHRNKRMIQLDLKSKEGHAAFMRLVEKADVVVENMRPSVKHRLKVDYDSVHKVNPRVVYASISGFGQDGPYADRAGVDQIAQGMGGLMSITGEPGKGPMRVGIAIADLTAGNLLAMGIMMALYDRQVTGIGRWVQTSLLEVQLFMLDFQASRWLMDGVVSGQAGNDHPTGIPTGVFPTSDGYMNLAASTTRLWARFCEAVDKPDWKANPDWANGAGRLKDKVKLNAAVAELTRTKSSAYWTELLEKHNIPCGPIYSIDQAFNDPHIQHIKMSRKMKSPRRGEVSVVANPLNFTDASKDIRIPTRDMGADTEEVLKEFGFKPVEIADLKAKNIF